MKKNMLVLLMILIGIIGTDSRQAKAYSVKLQKDGIYAEVLPESVVDNSAAIFKKNVKKAMKYYKKYEDAFREDDVYTLATKVPDKYRDFISVAKQIQDSDEIIVRNPFFIYDISGNAFYRYYFIAEKNRKKLCLFSISIDPDTGKISFSYDKSMEQYFLLDEKIMEVTLFYKIDEITYLQTPERTSVVRDQTSTGEKLDGGSSEVETKTMERKFKEKSYDEKKDEILTYLTEIQKGRIIKKSAKNLKLELKDEYVEPEKAAEEGGKTGIYIAMGTVMIGGIAVAIIFVKKRKKE